MTIADFYDKHGLEGLKKLATGTGTKLSYIRALLYSPGKMPSLPMAIKLVRASGRELTYEGLAHMPAVAEAAPALAAE